MPLGWDPGQVHGPLARSAEDAALMLDAMVGLSRLSPISVAPPWRNARKVVAGTGDARGLRIAYVSDIAGIGVETKSMRCAGAPRESWQTPGASGRGDRIRSS